MSAHRTLAAADLDRTLIYSRRAAGRRTDSEVDLVCVEHYEGEPLSYMTAAAAALVAELARVAEFVPVTTRTRAQLARVQLPGVVSRYAVAANGGVILEDGEVDTAWSGHVAQTLDRTSAPLGEVWAYMQDVFAPDFTTALRTAEGLFTYAVTRQDRIPAGFLAELAAWSADRGWRTSLQGRKLYLVPQGLTKSAAIGELAGRVAAGRVLAAGDSLLDADMLLAADAAIRPSHGELADAGWTAAHVTCAPGSGVQAGEQIAAWLLAHADS